MIAVLAATLTIATPLVFGALGALLGERAGVLNLGIEGTLYAGAFVGFYVAARTGSLAVALLLGDVQVGAQGASIALQLPSQMGGVLTSVLLLTVVAALSVRRYRLVRGSPRAPDQPPEPRADRPLTSVEG